jgi:glucose-6-phosphate isomerase
MDLSYSSDNAFAGFGRGADRGIAASAATAAAAAAEARRRGILAAREPLEAALGGKAGDERKLGWFSLADSLPAAEFRRILDEAAYVRGLADTMIVIGIGGSNRGAMAAIGALSPSLASPVRVVFAGDTLSGTELKEALALVENRSVVLNVIAKDFNTIEPGIAFRVLRCAMMKKYGPAYSKRVVATGSRGNGQLFGLAEREGWRFLDFPESIGGRFSVLSAVGVFPMAVAGVDVAGLAEGARAMEAELKAADLLTNPAVAYAMDRGLLFSRGFGIESLVVFEPGLVPFARWWVQLFAETEGKTQSAIFPTYFSYSEDLHAVGQYVQEGRRFISETFLRLFHEDPAFRIEASGSVPDGFGYLDGKVFDELNRAVYAAALEAHAAGGVPCREIACSRLDAVSLGGLFYFFMFACYLSATILGVNPFDQEGVEGYKRNMYRLLGKAGKP